MNENEKATETDKYWNRIPNVCAFIFGIVAFFMLFAPNILLTSGEVKLECSGLNLAFGTPLIQDAAGLLPDAEGMPAYMGLEYTLKYFTMSPLVIAYIAVLVGIVCTVLDFMGIGGKIPSIIAASCLIVAGVLFFICQYIVILNPAYGDGNLLNELRNYMSLGIGSIIGGLFSCIAGVAMLSSIFLKKPHVKITVEY